jgi:hypothetical protein
MTAAGKTAVDVACRSLAEAREDLDDAVGSLPDLDGDDMMASPRLLALLLRVVTARRHLNGLESAAAAAAEELSDPRPAPRPRDRWP